MQTLNKNTIRTFVKLLTQKGYSDDLISRKLQSSLEYVNWAYHTDQIEYSDFQQIKDEIANSMPHATTSHTGISPAEATTPTTPLDDSKIPSPEVSPVQNTIPHKLGSLIDRTKEKISASRSPQGFSFGPQYIVGLGLVMLMLAILGAGIYQRFFSETPRTLAYPPTPAAASRVLSFQGRLTDSLGNPISTATNMRFRLYDAVTAGSTLYDSGTCSISPDQDGIHNVLIGDTCGAEIASSVFTENTEVWLGVTVGTDAEMDPRQQIANVPYAMNAETLQGLPVGTEASTIPYINQNGDLLMAASTPHIASTYASETFIVSSAQAITIQSAGSGDVTLTATESGTIKFATGGTQHGLITNAGLFGFGTTGPDAKLDVLYTGGEQLRLTYADGSAYAGFTTNSSGDLAIAASGGDFSFTDGTNTLVAIKDQGVYPFLNLAGKTDTGDPATCAEGDIYYNDTDDAIKICHESNTWEGLDGGGATQWTDGGTTVYLTDTTDEVVIGGSSPLSSGKFSLDGDADQIQLIVQGNATQTTSLAVFEQSDGTDVLTIANNGNLATIGDLAVNGDTITSDSNLALEATGYVHIGDSGTPGSANGDDDLYVLGDLEIDGTFYVDGTLDTSFTAGSIVFAGTSGVLAQDNAQFFWDDTNDKLGIGDNTPDAKLEVSGAVVGKALAIFDELGDQDIIAASASGSTRFRVDNDGTIYGGYLLDISNTAYGIDPAGTSNFGGYSLKVTGGALLAADAGNVGIGDQTPDAKLNILATTEQLRLDYDDSNYASFTVGSGGDLTVNPTGGQFLLGDTATLNIGGVTGVAYNAFSDSGTTSHSLASDDDVYVEGDFEVDGTLWADGAITSAGMITGADFSCTDCLDFAELEDTLDLDAALILNQGSNTWTQNFTGTTTTGYTYNADSLTTGIASLTSLDALSTGTGISLSSSSTALGTSVLGGSLANFDWTPGSTTTAATDLFRINIGPNGNVTNLLNITDNGTSVFRVAENGIESAVPHSFTASGDVSIAYDLLFSNQTASYIKSNAPLTIEAGESFESNDLTLKTYNSGDIILDAGGSTTATGSIGFYDSNVKAATVTTPIEFADSATDINSYRTNFTDETLVGAMLELFNAATGVSGGLWTDSTTNTYLTTTTDELIIGGTAPLSSAKVSIDGDADQIQLIVQGNGTQTTSLAVFENSAGTDQLTISNTGDLVATGDVAVNGGDITTSATTFNLLNATATTLNIGGAATTVELGAATGTTSINNALTVDGNTTLGNAASDTVTFTADVASHILPSANDTYTLGNNNSRWADLFLGPASLHIGEDGNEGIIGYDTTSNWIEFNPSGDGSEEATLSDAGTLILAGTLSANDITCTDCLDFAELEDTLDLDATTDINLGASNLTIDLDSTGIFDIRDGATTFVSFDDDSTIDVTFPAAGTLGIDAAATDSTTTAGVINLDVDTATSGNIGQSIDYQVIDAAGDLTVYGQKIDVTVDTDAAQSHTVNGSYIGITANDASSTTYGLHIVGEDAGGQIATAGIVIENLQATDIDLTTGLLIRATTDGSLPTAIDVSDAEITTALAFGANDIDGTNFDVTGSTGSITTAGDIVLNGTLSDTSGNLSFNDSVDITGNLDVSGTLTAGTADAFTVNATGNITTSGTTGLTFSSTGGIVLAGGTISDGTDGVDIADDLEIAGGTTLGDAIGDTVTVNAGAWTFANDTTVALTGGVNGINFDSNTLSIDATNNSVGIGTAAPAAGAALDIVGNLHLTGGSRVITTDSTNTLSLTTNDGDINISPGQSAAIRSINLNAPYTGYITASLNAGTMRFTDSTLTSTKNAIELTTTAYPNSSGNGFLIDYNPENQTYGNTTTHRAFNIDYDVTATSARSTAYTGYGIHLDMDDVVTTHNHAKTLYGVFSTPTISGHTSSTTTAYGGYFSTVGTTNGTGTAIGLYASAASGDFNYAGIFASGNVGIGDTSPTALLTVGTSDAFQVDASGNITTSGDLVLNGNDISSNSNLLIAATGYVRIGDSGTPGSASGDDDLYVLGDLEVDAVAYLDGNTILGDASGDTVTSNAAAWTFANDTTFALSGGVNGLNIDSNTLSVDATNDRIGIGTAAPDGKLHVTGASVGKALAIFNETGDQNIFVASDSGTGVFSIGQNGDMSRLESDAISGLPDSGSIVPNSSFELDNNANSYPDGWTESSAAQTTYMTTGGGHGEKYMSINNGGSYYVYSKCIPISSSQTYALSARARNNVGADNMFRMRIVEYPTRSDCQAASNTSGTATTATLSVGANWAAVGSTATTASTSRWGSVEVVNVGTLYPLEVDGLSAVPSSTTTGLDLAETYPAATSDNIQVAEIVSFGTSTTRQDGADVQNITRSTTAYDKNAFGVIATKPGLVLDDDTSYEKVQVALKGRVPVLVTTENGPINIGDPITASSIPGVGMKATRSGRVLGYAMTEWTSDDPHEIDQVTLFVNPETYIDLSILTQLPQQTSELISSALVQTEKLVAQTLKATQATIDDLIVDTIVGRSATLTDAQIENLNAQALKAQTIEAQKVTSDEVSTTTLSADSADISGTLTADHLDSTNIREMRERLEKLAAAKSNDTNNIDADQLSADISEIQSYITQLTNEETPENVADTSTYQLIDEEITIDPGTTESLLGDIIQSAQIDQLTVTGTASMTSLTVADAFSAGDVFIQGNTILSMNSELKLGALERVSIMQGAVVIAANGTITSKGEVVSKKGFAVENESGDRVAQIDEKGSARFTDLALDTYDEATSSAVVIAARDNYRETGLYAPAIKTNAQASGNGILPEGENDILIFHDKITPTSKVNITPTSTTLNKSLYVDKVETCTQTAQLSDSGSKEKESTCRPYFRVALDDDIELDVTFNWFIIH